MKGLLTANDVLSDIEFELVQGAISRDELGQGLLAVRQYQNKVRAEALDPKSRMTSREVASRQFQINDMLLTLLQEMAAAIQSVRLELRRAVRFSSRLSAIAPGTRPLPPGQSADSGASPDSNLLGRDTGEIEAAMRSESLHVGLDVRSAGLPIIGGLVAWLRINLHNLSLFYVERLADRQSSVNRTYGDWLLHLNRLNLEQQEQIEFLTAQVAVLQARLRELEQSSLPPARS